MHGHHPDQVLCAFEPALHFDVSRLHPCQEAGHGRHRVLFEGQCLIQQLINSVLGLGAEPGQQPLSTSMPVQDVFEQFVRRHEIHGAAQVVQCRNHIRKLVGSVAQLRPKRPAARAR